MITFETNASGAIWWPTLQPFQVVPLKSILNYSTWKIYSKYGVNTLGPLCLWQCLCVFSVFHFVFPFVFVFAFVFAFVFVLWFEFIVLLGSASTGTLHLYSGWHALPASMMYLASLPLSDLFIIDLNIFDDRFGFFLLSRFAYHCLPCFGCQNFDDFKQRALQKQIYKN